MAEYIDREAALRKMRVVATEAWKMSLTAKAETVWNQAQDMIKNIPAADVAPVKRGKWIWDEDGMDYGIGSWVCGNCKSRPETVWQEDESIIPYRWSGSHFCPNCGAMMEA